MAEPSAETSGPARSSPLARQAPPPVRPGGPSVRAKAPSLVAGALLALAMGVCVLVPLAVAWVYPELFPFAAPLVVVSGATALWGAARVDQMQLMAEVKRLTEENTHLTQSLGWLSDTARELRESEHALNEARQKAEAANQAKSRLLATVSHEFRTPLNGILGLTGLLLETEQTPDQQTYARGVHSSGEALLALVDDMLDFSKIEAGRLDLRPVPTDPGALLQEIAELLAARAHGKGIDIAADVPADLPVVVVDASRLRQVLLNLAGNAVKFTERGGVALSADAARKPDGSLEVTFSVSDTGPGIPLDAVDRLFREFEQLEPAPTRRHGGAGLGLAISQRIVRAMGGDVAVGERPGGGTTFAFTLALPVASASPRAPPADLSGRSVLILAPSGAEPPVLASGLARADGAARVASTPYEAAALVGAAAAAHQPYDALLIDGRMSAGPDTVLKLLREAAGSRIPAAVLIEPGNRAGLAALRAAGFDAYLVRPVRQASLIKIVAEISAATGGFRIDPGDAQPNLARSPLRGTHSLAVLVAEDNEINALLSRAVLEGMGHKVDEVRDGVAAVAAAKAHPGGFPLILMDLHMPGLDGLAAVREIRSHERATGTAPARILAVTADVLPETRAAAMAAGADQVLEKPMTPDSLRRALTAVADAA